jgi:hypothetical protein
MGTVVGGIVIVALIIAVIVLGVLYSQKSSAPSPAPACLVPAVTTTNATNLKAMLDSQMPNCPIGTTKMASWLDGQGAQAVPVASSCPSGLKVPDTPPVTNIAATGGSPPPSAQQSGVSPVQGAGFKLCVPNSFTNSSPALPADVGSEMMACVFAQAATNAQNGPCSVM